MARAVDQRCRLQLALIIEKGGGIREPRWYELLTRTSYSGSCNERKLWKPQPRRIMVIECASLPSIDFILGQCSDLLASVVFITFVIVAACISHSSLIIVR